MKFRLLTLLLSLFCISAMQAAPSPEEIEQLQEDMQRFFNTKERETFTIVTNRLMDACKETGNERLFYKAWSYQSIYEAKQQNYALALKIVRDILDNARADASVYGEYTAMHTEAMVLMEKHNFEEAERTFLRAIDFHHRHFPNESAGDDLMELMQTASNHHEHEKAAGYARQILNEANVDITHKGKALFLLCQVAFDQNDKEQFNTLCDELMLLQEVEGIDVLIPLVRVNREIINGDIEGALILTDSLDIENSAERKAHIYHLMGNDASAYQYMRLYKRVSDSLMLESHNTVVADYYNQMTDSRMLLEQNELERENNRLRNYLYLSLWSFAFLAMLFFIWRSRKLIKSLSEDKMQLVYERKDAERALTDLNELSFFESHKELPLTTQFCPNAVCNRLADYTQAHCHKSVAILFQTDLTDDFELTTNADALKKLLIHLLNYSARFTKDGTIKLSCADAGETVLFAVTDTSAGLGGGKNQGQIVGMFAERDNKIRYVGMNFNICQSITRLLHGRIWHDMEYTNGTRFCFEIPKSAD